MAISTRAALILALAALGGGCVGFRTHDPAPPGTRRAAFVRHASALIPKPELRAPRTVQVALSYEPGIENPLGAGERICADLVPLWPYARGEWPHPDFAAISEVVEGALARPFLAGGETAAPDLLLEVAFGPDSYRRYTRTIYGLSLYGGLCGLLGIPTDYATIRLDAEIALRDLRTETPGAGPLLARRVRGEETACAGSILLFIVYNHMGPGGPIWGPPPVRWEDILAAALADFATGALAALGDAFPKRCAACALDYEAAIARCERCGGPLAPR